MSFLINGFVFYFRIINVLLQGVFVLSQKSLVSSLC